MNVDQNSLDLWVQEGEGTSGFKGHGQGSIVRNDDDVGEPIGP